eukprot:247953-Prorocentrum_minimum.AAC.2
MEPAASGLYGRGASGGAHTPACRLAWSWRSAPPARRLAAAVPCSPANHQQANQQRNKGTNEATCLFEIPPAPASPLAPTEPSMMVESRRLSADGAEPMVESRWMVKSAASEAKKSDARTCPD